MSNQEPTSTRHKILLQTDAAFSCTGLAENGRTLFNWLARRGKYDLVYYGSQSHEGDPNHARMPYKSYGTIPDDTATLQRLAKDPYMLRQVYYGSANIEKVIKAEHPTIALMSNDPWAFHNQYYQSEWFKKINSIFHLTIDSIPITSIALEQAEATKYCLGWTDFAAREMRKCGPKYSHVDFIYGASDTNKFRPISVSEKKDLRKKFGIGQDETIFLFLSKNQLRKQFVRVLEAFSLFKKENPKARARLLFHTDWSEKASNQGWNIPKMIKYYGISSNDVLCTYICTSCGQWEVRPYGGEAQMCKACGAKKSLHTVDGTYRGVPNDEMSLVYGLCDAGINAMTSGGLEYGNVQTLLCGLPLATTNYSCGEDFCKQPFVYPIKWYPTDEVQSTFIKAKNDEVSIKDFMVKIYNSSSAERQKVGEEGRDWATKTFSIETIGPQWEKLFDSMPMPDWSSITLEYKKKNENFPMPDIADNKEWLFSLYKNILLVEPDPNGLNDWLSQLNANAPRDQIYQYFLHVAREDNKKNTPAEDFGKNFDGNKDNKKILMVVKGCDVDAYVSTSLFAGIKKMYGNNSDLYVAAETRLHEIFAGNPYVFKTLPLSPSMESEAEMLKHVDHYHRADKELTGMSKLNNLVVNC